jgi:hypothetical protein
MTEAPGATVGGLSRRPAGPEDRASVAGWLAACADCRKGSLDLGKAGVGHGDRGTTCGGNYLDRGHGVETSRHSL